jgi:UDP-glucose 4-epimerase
MRLTYDTVLVTGGMGFIGSHTVDALLFNGANVWVLDDLSGGHLNNLQRWKRNPRLHFKKGSLTNYKIVDSITRRVDAVIHLAAVVSPLASIRRPETSNNVNVSGTLNVLRAGLKNEIDRVVFASSSSLYGNTPQTPISEDTILDPITPYGVSKLAAEKYCKVFCERYNLSTISLRYFNVYGERQSSNPYSGVIAIFRNRLVKGLRPQIFGDGRQTRDFVHVSDVARANLLALQNKQGNGEAFNVGTGGATTINRLAKILADLTGRRDITPVHLKAREGDIRNSCADITKARRILRFVAEVPLRHGLRLLIKNQRQLAG